MTMPGFDPADYAVYVLEAYRRAKGLSGAQVARLFDEADVFRFLEDCGDSLHCQSDEATIADIDEFIKGHAP
jgi:hypothetical protein